MKDAASGRWPRTGEKSARSYKWGWGRGVWVGRGSIGLYEYWTCLQSPPKRDAASLKMLIKKEVKQPFTRPTSTA